jgi:hypothetical protein
MLDGPTLADGSDHTDKGLPAAALVDSPWLLAGEAVSTTEVWPAIGSGGGAAGAGLSGLAGSTW